MNSILLSTLKRECHDRGRGRKAWWARKLGVPPLTLSHWLAGRQSPNGHNAVAIRETLNELEQGKKQHLWETSLWESYYLNQEIPAKILPPIILEVLSLPTLKVRTAALLVRMLKKKKPLFEIPSCGTLQNRLGWILEGAGLPAHFPPDRSEKSQHLFRSPAQKNPPTSYLRRHQTAIGKKWRIYDCPLDSILESLP